MFYSHCLVSRKGPLGAIWLAAYFFKKLNKAQVNQTDIPSSVDKILQNELDAVAYRVLAYLLLGVVRIFSKKVDYLFNDCNKVLINITDFVIKEKNIAQKENVPVPHYTIALPERLELDAFDLGILEDLHGDNVKPQEDITLKEGDWQIGIMGQCFMEKFEDYTPITLHHTCSAGHDKIEGDGSACDMDMYVENAGSMLEENAIREIFCNLEEEPLDRVGSSRNQLIANEQIVDSESDKMLDEMSWEKIRHDGFHIDKCINPEEIYEVERKSSGNLPTEGKAKSVSEMCHDMGNPSNLLESPEKLQDHGDEERMDNEMLHGTGKGPSDVAEAHQDEAHSESKMGDSFNMTFSKDGTTQVDSIDTPVLVTPEVPPQLKIPESSGPTTPHFTVIPTPTAKEGARVSRKRKCLIDSAVIIPNKFIKQWIEDSSELVAKRKKVPHTSLASWRTGRLSNRSQCFFDPLIPYGSSELRLLFLQGNTTSLESPAPTEPRKPEMTETTTAAGTSVRMENAPPEKEVMETPPQAAVILADRMVNDTEMIENPTSAGTAEQTGIASETVGTPKAAGISEQIEIAPETPVRESKSIRFLKSPESPNSKEVRPPNSSESFDEESETLSKNKDLDLILMQEELASAHERGDSLDGWSGRTRMLARYLEKTFLRQRKRGYEEMVSLLQHCRGRTRKENAKLFYETLVLKTRGYVDVKQDYPYRDILLMQLTR